jgi:hypothetical protein
VGREPLQDLLLDLEVAEQDPRRAVGHKIWDAPTLQAYPQHIALMKRAVKQAAAGKLFNEEVQMERDGVPTAYLDVSVQPVHGPDGKVVKDGSNVTIDLSSLKSDQARRDNFLRRSTLETSKYPQAELVPVALEGLLLPIAAGSSQTFSVRGDLTVHGATHPTTWQVTARGEGDGIVGTATTAFTFKDFGLQQPKVPVVLSVADTIRLEYDFRFVPDTAK